MAHLQQCIVFNIEPNLAALIGEYIFRQNAQQFFLQLYNNSQPTFLNQFFFGIKSALRNYTILIIDSHLAYIYRKDNSHFVQFPLDGDGFKILRNLAFDNAKVIEEVHFRQNLISLQKTQDALQSLSALRVLNFLRLGGPQQNFFHSLIESNASHLEVLRNCQGGQILVPTKMLNRLLWIGTKVDSKVTFHYYRTIPFTHDTLQNRICYEMWFLSGVKSFDDIIQNVSQQIADEIRVFRIQINHWKHFIESEHHIIRLMRSLANLKRKPFRQLESIELTFKLYEDNSLFDDDWDPNKLIQSVISYANIMIKALRQTEHSFAGIKIECRVLYRIFDYYSQYAMGGIRDQMNSFIQTANIKLANTNWSKIDWNEEDDVMTGIAIANKVGIQFEYRLGELMDNANANAPDRYLLQCMNQIDSKFD